MEKSVQYRGKLRALRIEAGIKTQKKLADRTGISPTIISDLERGRRPMNPNYAWRIAEALGTTYNVLMEDEGK